MSKTLAELRAQSAPKLPTRVERICLNHDLLQNIQRLQEEKKSEAALAAASRAQATGDAEDDDSGITRVRKMAEGGQSARVAEIDAELATLWDQMREDEGELLLRGIDGAKWQAFKDNNPPRDGNRSDDALGYGLVNTTALMADLATYVVSWNGEPLADGDWKGWLSAMVAPGDLAALVTRVVEMQEARVAVPKAVTPSPETTSPASGDA